MDRNTMSAYQVDTDLIDLIVSATTERDYNQHNSPLYIYLPTNTPTIYTAEMREMIEHREGYSVITLPNGQPLAHLGNRADRETLIGRELIAANCASLAARYSDTNADKIGGMIGYLPTDYTYRRVCRNKFADYGHVFGALACFEYQSCETGERTLAELITERTRKHCAAGVADETDAGRANWGSWSREYQQTRLQETRAQYLAAPINQ
jgi:hypothetical protein